MGHGAPLNAVGDGPKLRPMKAFRRVGVWAALLIVSGCERGKSPPPADSASVKPAGAADSVIGVQGRNWDASAGPVLLIATDAPNRALLVVPDSATSASTISALPQNALVTLLSRGGAVQSANLPAPADSGVCTVATLDAAPPPHPWNIGFVGGVVSPLPMDSISLASPADSASVVVWLSRLASTLPTDSAGRFAGLPFVVKNGWHLSPAGAPQVYVGSLTRQINQEATPLQENTFVIAERAASDTAMTLVYSERSYGDEETIQSREPLAALLLGANRNPALIIARDFGDANAYALIERGDDGKWRSRWSSARRHCN